MKTEDAGSYWHRALSLAIPLQLDILNNETIAQAGTEAVFHPGYISFSLYLVVHVRLHNP